MSRRVSILLVIGVVILSVWMLWLQHPANVQSATVSTLFTYQGYLEDGDAPASGRYDFVFKVFDAASSGQQIGESFLAPSLQVVHGRFSAPLPLSSLDRALYVEVSVRSFGGDSYTTLMPRQALAPVLAQSVSASGGITRTHSVSAAAFVRDLGSANVLMDNDIALRWAADVTDEAGFYFARPPDWDRTSPIKVHIYFALGGNGAGAVNWRLKLNTYTPNSGEWLTNPGARGADTLLTFPSGPSSHRIYSQTFTLTDAGLANEPLWSFYFLRGNAANSETFTDYLYVLSADVEYLSAQ